MRKPKVGEKWVKYEGGNPFLIVKQFDQPDMYDIKYIHSNQTYFWQQFKNSWKHYEENESETKENTMTPQLYEIKINDEVTFGTKLAVNSNGDWVVELKNSGEVVAVSKDQCEKVIPYSVGIKFLGSGEKTYNYLADKGVFEVGDLLIGGRQNSLAQVIAIDTKSERADKRFTGWKVQATQIK